MGVVGCVAASAVGTIVNVPDNRGALQWAAASLAGRGIGLQLIWRYITWGNEKRIDLAGLCVRAHRNISADNLTGLADGEIREWARKAEFTRTDAMVAWEYFRIQVRIGPEWKRRRDTIASIPNVRGPHWGV